MTLENLLAIRQLLEHQADAGATFRGNVPVRTVDDYNEAIRRLSAWFDDPPERGSDEGNAFEALLMRVAEYESEHFPI